jgi:hypothetical protein
MLAKVQQHSICMLLVVDICADVAQGSHSYLVQLAMGPSSTEKAALVIGGATLQHR